MTKKNSSPKKVLITGGSSGIGFELAKQFLNASYDVAIVARSAAKLQNAVDQLRILYPNCTIKSAAIDLTEFSNLKTNIESIIGDLGGLDVLVNNAGTAFNADFEALPMTEHRKIMDTNYFSAVEVTRICIPYLLRNPHAHIAFTASVASLAGLHGYTAYCGSKFALLGFAESLRQEYRKKGLTISVCYPPDTDTPLLAKERLSSTKEIMALSSWFGVLSADVVARKFFRGIHKARFDINIESSTTLLRVIRALSAQVFFKIFDTLIDLRLTKFK